jgi:hypothetical protein
MKVRNDFHMNLTIFDGFQETAADQLSIEPHSLYCAFEQVKDGRNQRGKRSPYVTLQEDASQVRIAGAPLALAALNGAVLARMDWLHVPNVPAQMRRFCARPHEALQLVCGALRR